MSANSRNGPEPSVTESSRSGLGQNLTTKAGVNSLPRSFQLYSHGALVSSRLRLLDYCPGGGYAVLDETWKDAYSDPRIAYRPARTQADKELDWLLKWVPPKGYPLSSMKVLHKKMQEARYKAWLEEASLRASPGETLTDGYSREIPFIPSNGWWLLLRVWPRSFRTVQPQHAWVLTSTIYQSYALPH